MTALTRLPSVWITVVRTRADEPVRTTCRRRCCGAARRSLRDPLFCGQLEAQLPEHLDVFPDVDVDLQLVPPDRPGTVRRPDLAVVTRDGFERREREGGVLRASELIVAIEVLSPGSVRVDRVLKNSEYGDAGIPYYWLVDIGEKGDRPQLTAHHAAGEFGYVGADSVSGTFTAAEPFPIRIDLDALV